MLSGIIQLEIVTWEKFNPRKDLKSTSWFRLQNDLFENSDFFDFDHSELCFWVYLLSIASKKQTGSIGVNVSHAVKIGRFQKETILSSLEKLEEIQCVRVTTPYKHADVTRTSRARTTTNERTRTYANVTERNETNELIADEPEKTPTHRKPSADSASAEIGKQASQVIAHYCELWKAKYKTQMNFSGKWAGNAKTLVKDHGLIRSLALVEAFLEMNDRWFLDNRHSFDLILTKLASVTHYAGTGVQITQTQLKHIDQAQTNMNLLEKVRQGKA